MFSTHVLVLVTDMAVLLPMAWTVRPVNGVKIQVVPLPVFVPITSQRLMQMACQLVQRKLLVPVMQRVLMWPFVCVLLKAVKHLHNEQFDYAELLKAFAVCPPFVAVPKLSS